MIYAPYTKGDNAMLLFGKHATSEKQRYWYSKHAVICLELFVTVLLPQLSLIVTGWFLSAQSGTHPRAIFLPVGANATGLGSGNCNFKVND